MGKYQLLQIRARKTSPYQLNRTQAMQLQYKLQASQLQAKVRGGILRLAKTGRSCSKLAKGI